MSYFCSCFLPTFAFLFYFDKLQYTSTSANAVFSNIRDSCVVCDMVWCYVMWCDVMWCDVCLVWCDVCVVWCGVM